MSLKNFLYYLTTEDGRSHYVQNGVVTSRGLPTPLPQSPDGWQDIAFAWERNDQKHGLQRSFSKDLGFVGDGAEILRDAFFKTNVDRKMYLLVQKLKLEYTTSYYKWLYEYLYKGEVDLSTVKSDQDSGKVTASLMEGGLSKLLSANQATQYSIPFDGDAVNIKFDGIDIKYKRNFTVLPGQEIAGTANYFLGMQILSFEGISPAIGFVDVQSVTSSPYPNDNYFAKAVNEVELSLTGTIKLYFNKSVTPTIRLEINDGVGTSSTQYVLYNTAQTAGTVIDVPISQTATIPAGHRAHIKVFGGSPVDPTPQFTVQGSDLKAEYNYKHKETYAKAYTRATLFKKLCQKVLGHEEYAVSTLFANDDRLVTSFDAIRGIQNSFIKTSLNDFFADTDTDLMAGMSIEDGPVTTNLPAGKRLLIEERARYYNTANPIVLGNVKELVISFDAKKMASTIKTGWKEPQVEDTNGKYSFNAINTFTTPQKRTSNEYNLVSPYKADPFEIEIKRINLEGKTTTDDNSDNDTVVVWAEQADASLLGTFSFVAATNTMVKPVGFSVAPGNTITVSQTSSNDGTYTVQSVSGNNVVLSGGAITDESSVTALVEVTAGGPVYTLKRETYTNETDPDDFGVPSPTTIFNIDLSPKRKLLRHKRWIASMLYKYETEKIVFSSATKNGALKTVQTGSIIQENADISINTLGTKLFYPYLLTFKIAGNLNLAELMEENPNRCFQFTWNGKTYTGFNIKSAFAANELNEQEYQLLSTATNDLTEFI